MVANVGLSAWMMNNAIADASENVRFRYRIIKGVVKGGAFISTAALTALGYLAASHAVGSVLLSSRVVSLCYAVSGKLLGELYPYRNEITGIFLSIFNFSTCIVLLNYILFVHRSANHKISIVVDRYFDSIANQKIAAFTSESGNIPSHTNFLNKDEIKKLWKNQSTLKETWFKKLNFEQISFVGECLTAKEFESFVRKYASRKDASNHFRFWLRLFELKNKPQELSDLFSEYPLEENISWILRKAAGKIMGEHGENFYVEPLSASSEKSSLAIPGRGAFDVNDEFKRSYCNGKDFALLDLGIPNDTLKLFFSLFNERGSAIFIDEAIARDLFLLAEFFGAKGLERLFYQYPFITREIEGRPPTSELDVLRPFRSGGDYHSYWQWRRYILFKKVDHAIESFKSSPVDPHFLLSALREAKVYGFNDVRDKCYLAALLYYKQLLLKNGFEDLFYDDSFSFDLLKRLHNSFIFVNDTTPIHLLYVIRFNKTGLDQKLNFANPLEEFNYINDLLPNFFRDPLNVHFVRREIGRKWGLTRGSYFVGSIIDRSLNIDSEDVVKIKILGKGEYKINKNILNKSKTLHNWLEEEAGISPHQKELEIPSLDLPISKETYQLFFDILRGVKEVISLDKKTAQELLLLADYFETEELQEIFFAYLFALRKENEAATDIPMAYIAPYVAGEVSDEQRKKGLAGLLAFVLQEIQSSSQIPGLERAEVKKMFDEREVEWSRLRAASQAIAERV